MTARRVRYAYDRALAAGRVVRLADSPRRRRNRVLWALFWVAVGIVAVLLGCACLIAFNVTGGVRCS